jgi:hypothetical protein
LDAAAQSVLTFVNSAAPTALFAVNANGELGFIPNYFPLLAVTTTTTTLNSPPQHSVKSLFEEDVFQQQVPIDPLPSVGSSIRIKTLFLAFQDSTDDSDMPTNANTQQYRQGGRNNTRNSERADHNSAAANNNGYYRQNGQQSQQQQQKHPNNRDYWNKTNGPDSKRTNDENAGTSTQQPPLPQQQNDKTKPYYPRNDRYQDRAPSATAQVGVQRGPLPDWDEVGSSNHLVKHRSSR